jgi:hypothetical protein
MWKPCGNRLVPPRPTAYVGDPDNNIAMLLAAVLSDANDHDQGTNKPESG